MQLYLEEAKLLPELKQLGFGIVAFACTTCNRHKSLLDPKIQQDHQATAARPQSLGDDDFDGRIHPYAKQAFLASPPLVIAIAGTVGFNVEEGRARHRQKRQARHAQGHLAEQRRDRRDCRQQREAGTLPPRVRPDVHVGERPAPRRSAPSTTGALKAPTSAVRLTGKARWLVSAR